MITWGSIFILSVLLGVIISYVPSKWSWLLIIPITLLTLFVLNYYYDRLPTTSIGASMIASTVIISISNYLYLIIKVE